MRTPNLCYLIGFISIFLLNSTSYSARIKKISKKRKLVTINEGRKDGIKKGSKICFYSKSRKKRACGKVVKTSSSSSRVRVSKKSIRRIRKSYLAKLEDSKTSEQQDTNSEKKPIFGIRLSSVVPVITTYIYNNLSYKHLQQTPSSTLWNIEEAAQANLLAVNFEIEFPNLGLSLGGVFLESTVPFNADSNYNAIKQDSNLFVRSESSSSNLSAYLDYYLFSSNGFNLGAGLQMDMNSLSFKSTKKDDNSTAPEVVLFEASSEISVFSLKIPVRYDMVVNSFGLYLGMNVLIPLSGTSTSSPVISEEILSTFATAAEDLSTQLNHSKQSFALDVVLGTYYHF